MATLGTAANDTFYLVGPGTGTLDGLAGTDTLDFGTEPRSSFIISQGTGGSILIDSVSSASGGGLHISTLNIEKLVFPDQTIDLATFFSAPAASPAAGTTLTGTAAADRLVGTTGNDTINGGAGNDSINGGAGNDAINGGTGTNTVLYAGNRANYTITQNSNGTLTVTDNTGAEGTDTLTSVQRLAFADKYLAFDIESIAGQAYRMYQAAFNRTPDASGLGYWMSQMDNGTSLESVANFFDHSSEFQSMYGATPTNSAFVNLLYQNVLHRAPDQAGFDYWTGELAAGRQTFTGLLMFFSESAENHTQTATAVASGIQYAYYTQDTSASLGANLTITGAADPPPTSAYGYGGY
jgi:Ca2+-binding RTX toxin-like protein